MGPFSASRDLRNPAARRPARAGIVAVISAATPVPASGLESPKSQIQPLRQPAQDRAAPGPGLDEPARRIAGVLTRVEHGAGSETGSGTFGR